MGKFAFALFSLLLVAGCATSDRAPAASDECQLRNFSLLESGHGFTNPAAQSRALNAQRQCESPKD